MSAYDILTAGLSGAGLVLLGLVTVQGSSEYHLNAAQMQDHLQQAASDALVQSGQTWATVTMNGQRALIVGAPPSIEAAEQAKHAVFTSSGPGGALRGGVWAVDTEFSEIRDLPTASPYVWRAIKSTEGAIILVGGVPDDNIRESLAAHIRDLTSARLDDRTELTLGVPAGDWIGTAKFGLDQLDLLDSGEARLTDYELRLSGIAMADASRIQATASIANLAAPWTGIAAIDGPSHWKAKHVDGTLVLSGSCETSEDRAEIAAIAEAYFDGPVVDQMTVEVTEYEPWIEGVRLGLPHFSNFESGEMEFDPEGTGFSFDGEATSSTLQFLREDMAQLEGEYAVEIEAATVLVELEEISGVDLGEDPLQACQTSFDLIMDANAVVFESGSAEISRESGSTLDKIIAVSTACAEDLVFEVAGHTDNTGVRDANLALSRARAQAVANYMQNTGFDVARLIVTGYGPDRPESSNATPQGRAANRRIEFNVQERSE
ncbi:MAG: OmpA family protein [Pseudomonadota bacterium]